MSDSTLVKAPRLMLDEDNRVIDAESLEPVQGIAVLNARRAVAASAESPLSAMKRWSEFRQSPAKIIE